MAFMKPNKGPGKKPAPKTGAVPSSNLKMATGFKHFSGSGMAQKGRETKAIKTR
jgi:hypothetical protein